MRPAPLAALLLGAFSCTSETHGQIGVSPPRIELQLDGAPANRAVRLFNLGPEPIDVRVSVFNWEMDEKSEIVIVPPTEQSLDQWIAINPLSFTVAGSASQVVRFSVRPRVLPAPGEHRAILYFDEVARGAPQADEQQVLFRLGVVVYGYAGDVERKGVLEAVSADTRAVAFDLSSRGSAHVRLDGQYAIWSARSYPGEERTARLAELDNPRSAEVALSEGMLEAGLLPTTPILAGSRRTLGAALRRALPPGDYVLDINGTLAGEPLDRGIAFSIVSPRNLALDVEERPASLE